MKVKLLIAIGIIIASPLVAQQPKQSPAKKAKTAQVDESEKPPFVGMTKQQARSRYGEPKKHSVTDEGESWIYVLNYGEVIGKAFIPFNFHQTPIRTGVLLFGSNGKVKKFTWDVPTN
jgi:hypothetical protein